MNPKWLKTLLEEQPDAVAHEMVDDRILLTASPKELQAFVARYVGTEDAFGDSSQMKRKPAKAE